MQGGGEPEQEGDISGYMRLGRELEGKEGGGMEWKEVGQKGAKKERVVHVTEKQEPLRKRGFQTPRSTGERGAKNLEGPERAARGGGEFGTMMGIWLLGKPVVRGDHIKKEGQIKKGSRLNTKGKEKRERSCDKEENVERPGLNSFLRGFKAKGGKWESPNSTYWQRGGPGGVERQRKKGGIGGWGEPS